MCDRWEVARMIQVRDVPPELHAELVRRARLRGKTLTAYVQEILEREVERPPADEVFARIKARKQRESWRISTEDIVSMIREERGPIPPVP
jgi:cytochrome P450